VSAEPEGAGAHGTRLVIVVGFCLLVTGLVAVAVVTAAREAGTPEQAITASPVPTPNLLRGAGPTAAHAPASGTADRTDDATPASTTTPTAVDAAAFSSSFQPPGAAEVDTITVDLEPDGTDEVVVASLVSETVRVDVARWNGQAYEVVFTGQGGGADRLVDFRTTDLTGDGTREIYTVGAAGARGESLSVWGLDDGDVRPLRASGGCVDGSHVFGVAGVEVFETEIRATCDGSPLPPEAWPVDIYRWDDGRWRFQRSSGAGATPDDSPTL
jgi:hypothetical protein